MHAVGMVLHPERDSVEAVSAVLGWADRRRIKVLGIETEIRRLNCAAVGVTDLELGQQSDLVVSLGGDGTMLRAMRLTDRQRAPVLGVNLGKLGFLAEIDVPQLGLALSAVDAGEYTIEPRLAVDATVGGEVYTAFNDIAVVRFPGQPSAKVAVVAAGHPFVTYAADHRGRDAHRVHRIQLLCGRPDRLPDGGGAGRHPGCPALGLQPGPGAVGP
jgi:NAD+ kinase